MNSFKITPAFQQIFFTVVSLTLLSGSASFWLAANEHLSPQQARVFETCNTTWSMGIGAIFGLLGSKATDLFQTEEGDE
ncbi:MAG: hypothetical protein KME12_19840 [Trichocoleus desertorum ATA4-8-CV12]|jgi:hypothetical protein|nr:hypothetical protein [Trichocoleus desertorum ATA4-8-CV12]